MSKFKHFLSLAVTMALLAGCAPSDEAVQTAIAQTPSASPYPTFTVFPSLTPYPTYTLLPTYTLPPTTTPVIKIVTATHTPTPPSTSTPTPTWVPFNASACVPFTFPSISEASMAEFDEKLLPLVGKCVRFYFDGKQYVLGTDLVYMRAVTILMDDETPPDTILPKSYAVIWGILEAPIRDGSPWKIRLRKSEVFAKNQQPIESAGLYSVGTDGEMASGTWKSGQLTTWSGSCYWARINPANGAIKNNHFGIGGITVKVYEGDVFETNEDCLDWFFVSP